MKPKLKAMFETNIKSIVALVKTFPNDEVCIKYLEKLYWSDGNPVSPFDKNSKVYRCKNNRYRCKNTGKYFKVTTGTIFENTKINLTAWFLAIWFVTCHKPGISSYQLARDIGVTQKTAWYMRGGMLVAKVTKDTTSKTLSTLIKQHVDPSAILYTDENGAYDQIGKVYERYFVDHSKHLYGIDNITSNRIEASWTHLKRMVIGTYRKTSKKYLQKYVDEFVFRYNLRDVSDSDKFNLLLCCADTRVTHKQIRETICAA